LKWADGTPVTSADILATYSPKYALNATYDFTGVHKEISSEVALNSSAVQFTLNKPDATFLFTIGEQVLTGVYPNESIKGPTTTFLNDTATSAPFYPVNYTSGSTVMVLDRNPNYSPLAVPCQLDITFPESYSTIGTQLIAGSLDFGPIDAQSAPAILAHSNLHIFTQKGAGIIPLNYNTTLYPLNMTEFRQALVYGINQSQIVQQALGGYGETAYGAEGTVPGAFALHDPNQMQYSYNQTKAISLLNSIGIKKGSDGHLQYPNGTDITLKIWGDSGFSEDTLAMGILQSNLESLGFIITPTLAQWGTVFSLTHLGAAELTFMDNGAQVPADPISDSLPGWDIYTVPAIPLHYWMYPPSADAAYNASLNVVESTNNPANVTNALNKIQELSAQYLPVIPVVYYDSLFAYSTSRWTNWPAWPNTWFYMAGSADDAMFSQIQPVGASSVTSNATSNSNTASNSSINSQSSTAISSSATQSASTSVVTNASTSTTSAASGLGLTTIAVIVVVIIIIIGGVAAYMYRRRPSPIQPAKT
jgi:ABC-type transport system substrate-binding protein